MKRHKIPLIIQLQPDNFTFNLWGGRWIPHLKKLPLSSKVVGESWEFSGHRSRPNRITLPGGTRSDLRRLIQIYPKEILGAKVFRKTGSTAPFLLKFIDARDNLSLQVHPNDVYARRYENDSGKDEAWLILETGNKKGEGFIYLGFKKKKILLKKEFRTAAGAVLPLLNKIRVRAGEVYDVRPGTVHSIGRGVRLLEIQKTSDLTYRIWDWNRPVKRPLHLDKAFDVIQFSSKKPDQYRIKPRPIKLNRASSVRQEHLYNNRTAGFAWDRMIFNRKGETVLQEKQPGFSVLTALQGEFLVQAANFSLGQTEWRRVERGYSVLIPALVEKLALRSESNRCVIIKSFVPV